MNFCSREETSDKEDDEYEMHGQALPVLPFDVESVDEGSIPLTSQEYLQQVIAQRTKLPSVVTASVPKLKAGNAQNIAELFKEDELSPSEHCPSKEWIQTQVSDFSDLRFRIECNRETWHKKYPEKFPSDRNDWFEFMFGGSEDSEINQREPYLDIVLAINNEMIENLIKYIVEWVEEKKISVYTAGLWFYALLACIGVPIRAKIMKRLRTFVYTCRELRNSINLSNEGSEKEIMAQNLFICLIGKYFGQHDLSD
ncbi:gem-associated protein 2-like [Planococcus citri]|uniref:gem-associated protein 2-like n=1 Tax=Planococcus citri TaxID=170843 RepID=UPI0031F8B4AC